MGQPEQIANVTQVRTGFSGQQTVYFIDGRIERVQIRFVEIPCRLNARLILELDLLFADVLQPETSPARAQAYALHDQFHGVV